MTKTTFCLNKLTLKKKSSIISNIWGKHLSVIKIITTSYYIDRCELWGFIREINSGISHVRYQFFHARTTFTQL